MISCSTSSNNCLIILPWERHHISLIWDWTLNYQFGKFGHMKYKTIRDRDLDDHNILILQQYIVVIMRLSSGQTLPLNRLFIWQCRSIKHRVHLDWVFSRGSGLAVPFRGLNWSSFGISLGFQPQMVHSWRFSCKVKVKSVYEPSGPPGRSLSWFP